MPSVSASAFIIKGRIVAISLAANGEAVIMLSVVGWDFIHGDQVDFSEA